MTGLVWGVLAGIIAAVVIGIAVALWRYAKPLIGEYGATRRQGLRWIMTRRDERRMDSLRQMVDLCNAGDVLLVVARTGLGLVKSSGRLLDDALAKGAHLRFVLLDPHAIDRAGNGSSIDLRPLGLRNPEQVLLADLASVEEQLREKCSSFRTEWRDKGARLEVYKTRHLIENSVVALMPSDESREVVLNYDLSFGIQEADKFIQHYQSRRDRSDLCNRLYEYYKWFIGSELCTLWFCYPESRKSAMDDCLKQMDDVIKESPNAEHMRNNCLRKMSAAIPPVLENICGDEPVPPPLSVQIEVTNRCSTRCKHCDRFKWWANLDKNEMSTNELEGLIDELAAIGVSTVTFSGGEPLMRPDFAGLVRRASEKHLGVGVLTNGITFEDGMVETLAECADWVRFSVDGSNKTTYRRVRNLARDPGIAIQEDPFDEVIASITKLKDVVAGSDRCRIGICYTIQKQNIEDVPSMIDFVRRMNLPNGDRSLTFKFVHGNDGFRPTNEQLQRLCREVLDHPQYEGAANIPYMRTILTSLEYASVISGLPTRSLYCTRKTRCFAPYLFSVIDSKGGVYPCCYLYYDNASPAEAMRGQNLHKLGQYETKKRSFQEIWTSEQYDDARAELRRIDPENPKYSQCSRCTRHFNHNLAFTRLLDLYRTIVAPEEGALRDAFGTELKEKVWL